MTAGTRHTYLQGVPVGCCGVPEELAAAVYLALARSGYSTGVTLSVDGGFVSSGVIKPG